MDGPIGYYVHHQGIGHLQRAVSIATQSGGRVVLLGSRLAGRANGVRYIDLPDDRVGGDLDGTGRVRSLALHYAPLRRDSIRNRMSLIANWIAAKRPSLLVVDVSVEIAMLARLCSTPVVYVRLNGRRDDSAHLEAFRLADALLAPFDARLDDPETAEWVREKTLYCPGIIPLCESAHGQVGGTILVVKGKGGQAGDGNALSAAARFVPNRKWRIIGPCTEPDDQPSNLEVVGWVNDPMMEIERAEIVVGAAGDGLISHVLAAARSFICIPESRPYDEQHYKAAALKRSGAAVVVPEWPSVHEWPSLLSSAERLDLQLMKSFGGRNGGLQAYRALLKLCNR